MCTRRARGATLIELVVFIVIVGAAMAGIFAAFGTFTRASADPLVQKQVLAIAEALMEEITLQPFTYCDPDDANAATATGTGDCTGGTPGSEDGTIGPESSEDRYSTTTPFDNVSDYHNFSMTQIKDILGNEIFPDSAKYEASVAITQAGITSSVDAIPAADALKIAVSVKGPNGVTVTLEGYRTRYAPNTLP